MSTFWADPSCSTDGCGCGVTGSGGSRCPVPAPGKAPKVSCRHLTCCLKTITSKSGLRKPSGSPADAGSACSCLVHLRNAGTGEPLGQPGQPLGTPGNPPSGGARVPEPPAAAQQQQHRPQQCQQHHGCHATRQPGTGPVLIQRGTSGRGPARLPQSRRQNAELAACNEGYSMAALGQLGQRRGGRARGYLVPPRPAGALGPAAPLRRSRVPAPPAPPGSRCGPRAGPWTQPPASPGTGAGKGEG